AAGSCSRLRDRTWPPQRRQDFLSGSCTWCRSRSPPPPETRLRSGLVVSPGAGPCSSRSRCARPCPPPWWLLPGPPSSRFTSCSPRCCFISAILLMALVGGVLLDVALPALFGEVA